MLLPFAPMMRLATLNLSWLALGHAALGPGVLNRVGSCRGDIVVDSDEESAGVPDFGRN